jgi:hypothetical protein
VHNPVQTVPAPACTEPHEGNTEGDISPYNSESKREFAGQCENVQKGQNWAVLDLNQ